MYVVDDDIDITLEVSTNPPHGQASNGSLCTPVSDVTHEFDSGIGAVEALSTLSWTRTRWYV